MKKFYSTISHSLKFIWFNPDKMQKQNSLLHGLLTMSMLLFSATFTLAQDQLLGLTATGGPQFAGTAFSIKSTGTNFTVQQSFAKPGFTPWGDLTKGPDGNFYGMTYYGGNNSDGTIFKMTPTGAITIIRHLDDYDGGAIGSGNLILGNDGNFYGMTFMGGLNSSGTIFKITPAGVFTVLRHLSAGTDGGYAYGSLVKGTDGNFYGITRKGGLHGAGTIFRITPTNSFTVLRHLNNATDGGWAQGNLVQHTDGYFYGMTNQGGLNGVGTIFKINAAGAFTKLRDLNRITDGGSPTGSLVKGKDGNFYGMTTSGGTNSVGTIFKLTPGGSFTVQRHFSYNTDGGNPGGSLVLGSDGNFYGMTYQGGANNAGTIFKLTSTNTYTVLRHLNGTADGKMPYGSLVQGANGVFYGMTSQGGPGDKGTVLKITSSGSFSVLASFPEASKAFAPAGSLVQGSDGNFYGTTRDGGTYSSGTIFKLCNGTYSVIRSLNGTTNGSRPHGNLVQGTDGNFYGTTYDGGTNGYGTIFKVTPGGSFTTLRQLTSATDGANPTGSLIQGTDGNFYGLTSRGGSKTYGTIFKISATGTYTVLRHLDATPDGANPKASMVLGTDGNLYGMNENGGTNGLGTIFKITTAGVFTTVRHMSATTGTYPMGSLLKATDGNFYGLTKSGGTSNTGVAFKLTTGGTYTVLHNFNGTTEGYNPQGTLVQGSDGNFYGMTSVGGTNNAGTIFKMSASGTITVLRHLMKATDGANPIGNLIVRKADPIAYAQSVVTNEDTPKAITLTGTGGLPLIYTIVTPPKNGSLSGSGANRTYTPKANYAGSDSFTYNVTWGCQTSATKTVTITVNPVNDDAPVLAPIGNKTVVKGSLLSFTATATDPDAGQTRTFSLVNAPAGATINTTSGAFTWTPTATGSYSFTVKVTDNGSPVLSDTELITVTVTTTTTLNSSSIMAEEETGIGRVNLYPNPATDRLAVSLEKPAAAITTSITDASGMVVLNNKHQVTAPDKLEIEIAQLKNGLYQLQIKTESGMQMTRFVKH